MKITGFVAAANGIVIFPQNEPPRLLVEADFDVSMILKSIMAQLAESKVAEVFLEQYNLKVQLSKHNIKIEENAGKITLQGNTSTIEGAEKIKKQLKEVASGARSAKGLKNFIRLFEKGKVKHSMEELLTFMKKSDLTIADDGSIIGYKILRNSDAKDVFVDPHTMTVRQKLGSVVYMPQSKVNDNRRVACSTGLHVCSKKYLGYDGDLLTLVKVRPHDVIAVPENDYKMRCCAYQIVAILPQDIYSHLRNGGNIYDLPKGEKIMANVIAGNHPSITNKVEVGANGAHKAEDVKQNLVKANRKDKPIKPVPRVSDSGEISLNVRKLREEIAAIMKVKSNRRTEAQNKIVDYDKKFKEAKKMIAKGASIREAAKAFGMSRDSLSKWLSEGR